MVVDNIINYKDVVIELIPHYPNLNEYEIALGCFYRIEDFISSRTSYFGGFAVISIDSYNIPDGVNENCNVITEADFDKYLLNICYKLIEQIQFNRFVYLEMTYIELSSCVSCDISISTKKKLSKPKIKLRDYYIEDISKFCNRLKSTAWSSRCISLSEDELCKISKTCLRFSLDQEMFKMVMQNHPSIDKATKISSSILPKIKMNKHEKFTSEIVPIGSGKYKLYLFIYKPNYLSNIIRKFMFWRI